MIAPAEGHGIGEFPAHLFANNAPADPVVRYHITDDLWNSFAVEQVAAQKARMIETGRWHLPNNGGAYTIRASWEAAVLPLNYARKSLE